MATEKPKISEKNNLNIKKSTPKEKPKKTKKPTGKKRGRPKKFVYEFAEVNCVFHLKTGEKYTKKFNCAKTKEDIFVVSLMDLLQKERFYCVVMEVNPLRVTIINTGNIDRIEVDHE